MVELLASRVEKGGQRCLFRRRLRPHAVLTDEELAIRRCRTSLVEPWLADLIGVVTEL